MTPRTPIVTLDSIELAAGPMDQPEVISLDEWLDSHGSALDRVADATYPDPFTAVADMERRCGYPLALYREHNLPHTNA